LQANTSGGWSRAEPHKWADLCSDGEAVTSNGPDDVTRATEANANEACFLDDFRKGKIQEEDLRDALEYYAAGRELKGLGPSPIRESDIEAARLQRPAAKGDDIIIEEREPPLPSCEMRGREFKAKKGEGEANTSSDESSDGGLGELDCEQLKQLIRNLGGEPHVPWPWQEGKPQPRRELKAKKGGGLEVVEAAKSKKSKGGKGQKRVR